MLLGVKIQVFKFVFFMHLYLFNPNPIFNNNSFVSIKCLRFITKLIVRVVSIVNEDILT